MRFLKAHPPSEQKTVCANPKDCIEGNHLTLEKVDEFYGLGTAEMWLVPEILDLSEFCGCKGKITEEQLHGIANSIRKYFGYLKTTEVMLFLDWVKSGMYGKMFYGSIDPMQIVIALREFNESRKLLVERMEQEERERKRAEEERLHPRMSAEEFLAKHKGEVKLPFVQRMMGGSS